MLGTTGRGTCCAEKAGSLSARDWTRHPVSAHPSPSVIQSVIG